MTTVKSITHPLQRHGTHQRERLLKALIPSGFQLDDRDMADLLAFVAKLAPQISYIDLNGEANGDWSGFWQKDLTVLLSLIASMDLEQIRTDYRTAELALIRELDRRNDPDYVPVPQDHLILDLLTALIEQSFQLAITILQICRDLPANNALKSSVQQIIKGKLVKPFHRLIAFRKGTFTGDGASNETDYLEFIGETPCQTAWELDMNAFLCIDYEVPDADDREELWQLFLDFYKALSMIIALANKAFQYNVHSRSDHPPHIALMIAFLNLFRSLQTDLNAQTERHLRYYYEDVLRLQYRREIPDKVHIVFEIADNLTQYLIRKDALLLDGKDSLGKDRLYTMAEELVINKAALAEKKNLYFYKNQYQRIPVALVAADMEDGIKTPFDKGEKAWGLSSGKYIMEKINYYNLLVNSEKFDGDKIRDLRNKYLPDVAEPGLIIESPELLLAKSEKRKIYLTFPETVSLYEYDIFISTGEGLKDVLFFKENDPGTLYTANLGTEFPDIVPMELNGISFKFPILVIRYRTSNGFPSNYKTDITLNASEITLSTETEHLKAVTIQQGDRIVPSNEEIILAGGTLGTSVNYIYLGMGETLRKTINTGSDSKSYLIINDFNPNEALKNKLSIDDLGRQFLRNGVWEEFVPGNFQHNAFLNDLENTSQFKTGVDKGFFRYEIPISAPVDNAPIGMLKIPGETFFISYKSVPQSASNSYYHLQPFGGINALHTDEFTLLPVFEIPEMEAPIASNSDLVKASATLRRGTSNPKDGAVMISGTRFADANILLGFENILPGQTLSILFKMAPGTGNPDHLAPEIVWSYLRNNTWIRFPQQFILKDETNGLGRTGIVKLQIPQDINSGNTLVIGDENRTDLYWFQISCSEIPEEDVMADALPLWEDVFVQAGTGVFQNNNNTLEHLENGIPEGSISGFRFGDSNVKTVKQPFGSFGGRASEAGDTTAYYRRVSERLRHKNRAITVWDYERLLLEAFPAVAVTKCIPHTDSQHDITKAGHVLVAVIPYPEKMTGEIRRYYPILDAGDLVDMKAFLAARNSYWVGGQGASHSCCCHEEDDEPRYQTDKEDSEDCCCVDDPDNLEVLNARFEPVRLSVCVRFYKGKDMVFYRKQLNEDLKRFLAPWATDSSVPLLFGAPVYKTELLRFLEHLDYVDVVTGMKIKHYPDRATAEFPFDELAWEMPDIIEPFTPRSVLTTYFDILNHENPNVIDHDIHVSDEFEDCACSDCQEAATGANGQPASQPKYSDPYDLKPIEGIGPKVEGLLKKHGVDSWKKLSEVSPASIREILRKAGKQYNTLDTTTWPEQAKLLHESKWEAFEKRIQELKFGKDKK